MAVPPDLAMFNWRGSCNGATQQAGRYREGRGGCTYAEHLRRSVLISAASSMARAPGGTTSVQSSAASLLSPSALGLSRSLDRRVSIRQSLKDFSVPPQSVCSARNPVRSSLSRGTLFWRRRRRARLSGPPQNGETLSPSLHHAAEPIGLDAAGRSENRPLASHPLRRPI